MNGEYLFEGELQGYLEVFQNVFLALRSSGLGVKCIIQIQVTVIQDLGKLYIYIILRNILFCTSQTKTNTEPVGVFHPVLATNQGTIATWRNDPQPTACFCFNEDTLSKVQKVLVFYSVISYFIELVSGESRVLCA